ncbi:pyrroline-5-carboxylate reductase [Aspergillus saccharolyticus JOP 1030-1]|uniref:Pyrroline-5-carboxylate reductase n=1 Tax=Aspergillus saccharolyticus JOP 1030-1 TaxID=1450539 RepID=A0A318ZR06_9EURO|nr:pyrroline-5-carboxylate reductase [Aspergillus saccharolyticus JOP 1030-1]PYH42528.1 pyrroline-5-carboxylate reductase [Aspergillus saccharolyticus JOP 1030-1]
MASKPTLAIIGCGNMGSAILSGILDATRDDPTDSPFGRIIACTKTEQSAARLRGQYSKDSSRVEFRAGDNHRATVREAEYVMLGCKPYLVESVIAADGMADALAEKFIISVIAGKTPSVLAGYIGDYASSARKTPAVARAIPNVAASVRESMTVVELPPECTPANRAGVEWMFAQLGQVKVLAPELFDLGSMLVAALAPLSVAVDGILDGCVAEGMRRSEASEMTAQCLLGLAQLLKSGVHPAVLRESISSPRGCTIQSLLTVEKAGVRSAFAEAIINGTRHLHDLQKKQ